MNGEFQWRHGILQKKQMKTLEIKKYNIEMKNSLHKLKRLDIAIKGFVNIKYLWTHTKKGVE